MAAPTNSLERALILLKTVEQTPGGLTNSEISRRLKIPKSTVSYILRRLEREGYVVEDEATGRYKIGLATVALAHGALRETGIRSVAEPALYKLTSETGLSAGIGVLERGRVLLVDRVEGPQFVSDALEAPVRGRTRYRVREQRDIGRELPAHSTALGKVLLAYRSRAEVLGILAQQGLERSTFKTITSRTRLLAELEAVRKRKYAVSDEETYLGLRALSVPIFDVAGAVRAAVSVNGDPRAPAWDDLSRLIGMVAAAGRDISRRAGRQENT
jgi:IclR family transcriptional regulator, KDG regulon repressor